ncbi:ammonium transporter [Cycloclasticus pugetii]|uniref:ammonium transporter n=1 Tax=Cycloclasticus pugetii TaxID=34068 RepID=UPI00037CDAE0|nr:ammonium transporter [Cycloclasticus pugetii]
MDIVWVIVSTILVFVMQAGFLCLESGLVRSKNSINVAAKNISDFIVSSSLYWLFGFGLMFGSSQWGLFGWSDFAFAEPADTKLIAIFLFQMMFCGTAATLVSGAVAERMSFMGYMVVTVTIALFIYPFVGHWAWAGIITGEPIGWLEKIGFVDFAGSTVVHSVGGWVALAAVLVIGPRIGRFTGSASAIPGSSIPTAILGCLLIWLGWFGFNGGSTLAWNNSVPLILLNTCLAALAGGVVATMLKLRAEHYIEVDQIINGVLGGLVSITASCHIVSTGGAVMIGAVAGSVVFFGEKYLADKKIDDAIGVVPVHLFAGVWGTIALPFFALPAKLQNDLSVWEQLGTQLIGVVSVGFYSFGLAYVVFSLVNKVYSLRVSEQDELRGLNVAEHNISTEVFDLLSAMHKQQEKADFSTQVAVEPYTEVGQIAEKYNHVIDQVNEEIKQRDEAFLAFKQSERRKGAILDAAMDCIIGIDSKGRIQSFNPAAERCFGQTAGAIINRSFFKLFTKDRVQELNSASLDEGFLLTSGWVLERRNMTELQRYDGESFPAEVVVTRTVSIASEPLEYTLHIRDLSEQTKLQKRLETLAFNDSLTGLYNRAAFIRELERRINYHKSHAGVVALMFLDLDRFKKVNDVFGHKVGDQLLCEVGKRLSGVVRGNDLVGRWGGDEFVVAISGALDEEAINSKATEILHVMRETVELPGHTLNVLTSIGVAFSVDGERSADRLLQCADVAMYQAKKLGRDNFCFYTEEMGLFVRKRIQIEADLPDAISQNQLLLNYQPKVSCLTNEVVGFEALLRWLHPEFGLIPPGDFIPVVESSGLIVDVGEWVLTEVARQLVEWRKAGYELLPVAVNISGFHLHDESLSLFIKALAHQYQLNPSLLEVEITENALTGDTDSSIATMTELKKLGIKLSVDDFGTGYSSLSYLKKFPIDVLKIDRSFINECAYNPDDAAICMAIISLAKSLGLKIVAEGVESLEQLEFIQQQGCDIYQGYLYSRPLPASDVEVLLKRP